jgi:hypothetical protein
MYILVALSQQLNSGQLAKAQKGIKERIGLQYDLQPYRMTHLRTAPNGQAWLVEGVFTIDEQQPETIAEEIAAEIDDDNITAEDINNIVQITILSHEQAKAQAGEWDKQ